MTYARIRLILFTSLIIGLTSGVALLTGCGGAGESTGDIVATVGDREIEMRQITDYMNSLLVDYETPEDELAERRRKLDQLIEENLFVIGAYSKALDADIGIIELVDREKDKFLLDELFRHEVIEKATVSEAEIKEAYSHWFDRVRPMHILVESRSLADSIMTQLNNGEDFGYLAEKYSIDKASAVRGGDFGREFRWGELLPVLQDVVFSLEEGEVGGPVETDFGWHILKTKSRRTIEQVPLEQLRESIEGRLRRQAQERRRMEQIDELRERANLQLNTDALTVLRRVSQQIADTQTAPVAIQPVLPQSEFSNEEWGMILAAYSPDGELTLGAFCEGMKSRSPQSRPDVRSEEQVEEFAFQLALFDILRAEALRLGMDETPIYRERLEEFQESLMAEKMKTDLVSRNLTVTEGDVRSYYEAHPDSFITPMGLHVREVLVYKENQAREILRQAKNGTPLKDLASKYTQRSGFASKGGDLGWLAPDRYPDLYEAAKSMDVGDIIGPVSGVDQHSVIELIDTRPPQQRSFEDVQVSIFDRLKAERTDSIVAAYTDSMKTLYPVSINEDVLSAGLGATGSSEEGGSDG